MVRHTCSSPLVEVLGSFTINVLHEKSHVKYQVFRCVTGMCIDTGNGMRFSMNFGREKFLPGNFLKFVGNSIGMPVYSGIKFSKIWVTRNLVAQRIPRKCWINITEITVASSGSHPCIQ